MVGIVRKVGWAPEPTTWDQTASHPDIPTTATSLFGKSPEIDRALVGNHAFMADTDVQGALVMLLSTHRSAGWAKVLLADNSVAPARLKNLARSVLAEGQREGNVHFQAREEAGKARASSRTKMRRTRAELLADLKENEGWKDWYARHRQQLRDTFGRNALLFEKTLSITSQAATVKANVGLALKALVQSLDGAPFKGYLPSVARNLGALRQGAGPTGQKINDYRAAMGGDEEARAVASAMRDPAVEEVDARIHRDDEGGLIRNPSDLYSKPFLRKVAGRLFDRRLPWRSWKAICSGT